MSIVPMAAEPPWYVIRPVQHAGEAHFIAETTARVLRPRGTPEITWLRAAAPGIALAVSALGAQSAVAMADDVIVGFAWSSGSTLRMVYVKRDFRGEGIGLRLIWALGIDSPLYVRETTPSFRVWARTKGLDWKVRT